MRNLSLLLLVTISLLPAVAGADVVYFVSNPSFHDAVLKGALEEMGHTVDVVDNEDILLVNWNDYDFMLIGNQVFQNEADFPVNTFPAIILNTNYLDEWHWASRTSRKTSSVPLKTYINDEDHLITQGLNGIEQIYSTSSASVNYLHRYYRSPELDPITSTSNSSFWDTLNAVIATAEPGTDLRDGVKSNVKSVFFGIEETQYWTPAAKSLFQKSAEWLLVDFYPPEYQNVHITDLTNHSATINWETDKLSTSKLTIDGINHSDTLLKTTHSFPVSGLDEDTLYEFTLHGCNSYGFCGSSGLYSLTTDDETPPIVLTKTATAITNESAIIVASISEMGYFRVWYGTTQTGLDYLSVPSAAGTSGTVQLGNLDEKTTYYYRVQGCDDSGNCRNSSLSSFTTLDLSAPDAPSNLILSVEQDGSTITATWDTPTDDATSWNIYVGPTPDAINLASSYATTTTTTYSDPSSPGERYYVIRAEDDAANEGVDSRVVGMRHVAMVPGYNLVSLPLVPFIGHINSVMHQSVGYNPVSEIKRWDAVAQDFEVASFSGSSWNIGFQTMEFGRGYFMLADSATSFVFVGLPAAPIEFTVKPGMNLVGVDSREPMEITDIITQTPGSVKATEMGDRQPDGSYTLSTYTDDWYNTFMLMPGNGYWLNAEIEFTI